MKAKEFLEQHLNSKSFANYMLTNGVKEYKHFANIGEDFKPTIADVAMSLYESLGEAKCKQIGFYRDSSGMVLADGEPIGKSQLALGKFSKDLTISLWLEDVGEMGFSVFQLKTEMDSILWPGWFDTNVQNRITPALIRENLAKTNKEFSQYRIQKHPWYITLWIRLKEYPSKLRVKLHYMLWSYK